MCCGISTQYENPIQELSIKHHGKNLLDITVPNYLQDCITSSTDSHHKNSTYLTYLHQYLHR